MGPLAVRTWTLHISVLLDRIFPSLRHYSQSPATLLHDGSRERLPASMSELCNVPSQIRWGKMPDITRSTSIWCAVYNDDADVESLKSFVNIFCSAYLSRKVNMEVQPSNEEHHRDYLRRGVIFPTLFTLRWPFPWKSLVLRSWIPSLCYRWFITRGMVELTLDTPYIYWMCIGELLTPNFGSVNRSHPFSYPQSAVLARLNLLYGWSLRPSDLRKCQARSHHNNQR